MTARAPKAQLPPARRVVAAGLLGLLVACERPTDLTIRNATDETLTAVFDAEGRDVLEGLSLPPDTFVRIERDPGATAPGGGLVAYGSSGACAHSPEDLGAHWEIASADLALDGC